jgi:predicted RecA/RadA family phage recombinase
MDFTNTRQEKSMRNASTLIAGLIAAASVALVGCDVDKTREGNVDLPKYEVEKKQSGDVTLPKYDVTTPDVTVAKKDVEVTVPKVTTEKETVTVPDVDIKTGKEKKAEEAAKK